MNFVLLADFLIAKIKSRIKNINNMKESGDATILVATYGTLRKGQHNHYLLDNNQSIFVGECQTEPIYSMYHLGNFPAVQEKGNTSITLEVYRVTPAIKERLDQLEGHISKGNRGNFYDITTVQTPFGEATMYVINNRSFAERSLISSGDWKKS